MGEKLRGHPVIHKNDEPFYKDTGLPVAGSAPRPCIRCKRLFNFGKPDACLGALPGVKNACCGHGNKEDAYIQFNSGVVVRGFEVENYKWEKKGSVWKKINLFPFPEKIKE